MGARRLKPTTVFWIIAALLHVAAFWALVFPAIHKMVFQPDQAPVQAEADPDRLASARQSLLDLYMRRLRETREKLAGVQKKLDEVKSRQLASLRQSDPALVDLDATRLAGLGSPSTDKVAVIEHLRQRASASQSPIVPLYHEARIAEVGIVSTFESIRALQLAANQQLALSRAVAVTLTALPNREDLSEHRLTQRITSALDGRLKGLKAELVIADQESRNMLAMSERLLDLANGIIGDSANMGEIMWDVAGASAKGGGDVPFDEGKPYIGPVLLPSEMFAGVENTFSATPTFGRKLMPTDAASEWMSVDTWWMIGPFSHPGRSRPEDLDRVYPPENSLDLDAVYVGKTGADQRSRNLHWKYRQTHYVRVEPFAEDIDRYAIWYAYTEIYSDRDQKLWVAFGSDDYSVAWMAGPEDAKGKVVYKSPTTPQPWVPFAAHGFRQVEFKRGFNRLLVKLENAGGTTGFSVIICTNANLGM